MNTPTRLPARRDQARTPLPAIDPGPRPDLLPLAVLGMPVAMLPCAALTAVLGVWALVVAAVALMAVAGVAAWSMGGRS